MTNTKKKTIERGTEVSAEPSPLLGADDRLLTEAEVARRQGRSVKTLQNQRVNGDGIPFLKLGRSVRYRLSDVIAWEEAGRCHSTSEGRADV
jgi:hypothetical protein